MTDDIVQQLIELQAHYNSAWLALSDKENEYLVFKHEEEFYYNVLVEKILPRLQQRLIIYKEERFSDYMPYVKDEWREALATYIRSQNLLGGQFIKKLSLDTTHEFNHLLLSYKKAQSTRLKYNFLNQFFNNKSGSLLNVARNNIPIALKTIANLPSPQLQFAFINQNKEIQSLLRQYFSQNSKYETWAVLSQYCDYPQEVPLDEYYKTWIGGRFIHIKFCKIILGDIYEEAKGFIKQKNLCTSRK